jgi:transposase InsO family protein
MYTSHELGPILERAWIASDHLSGKLLAAILPALLTALETHHGLCISSSARAALTTASAATLDRLLRPLRRRRARQPRRLAPAPGQLRAQIPLRTWSDWTRVPPGALQGDLVLHCGESTEGRYCATLVAVDVATTWTELQAIWDLHQQRVTGGIQALHQRLPFPLREWHSDNGSEFINACLFGWCQRHGIRFTRGRPYRKNDQAWVEQRNGLLVRRLVGYDRYSSRAAWAVLQRLYGLLRLQHNFFRPVRKLLSKRRVGSKVLKRYDAAQTPYQRVLAAGRLPDEQRHALAQQFHALDPIALARDIQQTLDILWKLAETRRAPHKETARG